MDKSFVTVTQRRCLICGVDFDIGELMIDRRMRKTFDHTTVVGMGLCPEHQKLYDDGFVALVGIDPDKSTCVGNTLKFDDAYRTGTIGHLRMTIWEDIFNCPLNTDDEGKPLPFVFVEDAVIKQLAGE